MMNLLIDMTERGLVPDPLVRVGIRRLCSQRLKSLSLIESDQQSHSSRPLIDPALNQVTSQWGEYQKTYAEMLKKSPVALATDAANEQHYEVPAEFFQLVLGPHRKYSCAFWPSNIQNLEQAEEMALDLTMNRAELRDGMKILELGCGWGSLTLAMAARFPKSEIIAISNSHSQRKFIEMTAAARNLRNVRILTRDVSRVENLEQEFGHFDRVVSVEMFEHFRNYAVLLNRISHWLKPEGKLFIHIFTHQKFPYLFETEGSDNWMGKYFFTGGQMPSHQLMAAFQDDLKLEKEWAWDGTHYQKTSEAWLQNQDRHREKILQLFTEVYGADQAKIWFQRWRIFFLAVAELFGFRNGQEWGVSHYLFSKNKGV